MTTIDLGEITDADPARPLPLNHPRIRRAILAGAAILGLCAVGGSARPAAPAVRPVWSAALAETDETAYSRDTAYLSRAVGGRIEITAYDLTTGRPSWSKPIDSPGPVSPVPVDGVVLLRLGLQEIAHEVTGAIVRIFYRTTVALDGATGAELWRAPGEPGMRDADSVLLEGHDERGRTDRLTRVRVRDGKTVWSRAVPGTRESTTTERDGKAAEVVTITDDNRLTVLRLADGVVTGRGRLSPPVATIRGIGPYLAAADSLDVSSTTTVYRVDDFAPLWSTADGGLDYCRPVFCRYYEGDLAGLEPATGREVWHRPGEVSPRPWPGGRLLLTGPEIDGADPPAYQVVDAATGHAKGSPGRGLVAWQPEPADVALVLRLPISDPGRTSVTRVDLATGRSTLVGTTDVPVGTDCADLGRHLACRVLDGLVVLAVD